MKNSLQILSSFNFEEKFSGTKDKAIKFINTYPELFCILLLTVSCVLFLFFGLGAYPLMDVDETRYAIMARDMAHAYNWNNLMLNGAPFLEKPPLYFWLVGASINAFKAFTPFVVRFPIALITSFLVFFTYYLGKRAISRKYGMLSALILLSSIFFLLLAHVAIIDMVLTVFMTSAIYFSFLTHFCEEKNKKYYWFGFYVFVALAFLAKGILGLVIPALVVLLFAAATKTLHEFRKPINWIPGLIALLLISLPWHIIMFKTYGFDFIYQYFLIHHFGRFLGSEYLGRERPFWYFIPVFLIGFLPWTFSFATFVFDGCKKLVAKYKEAEGTVKFKLLSLLETENNEQKLILFAGINFIVIFLLFSLASTKLPTYILPAFPAASLLAGYYWFVADTKKEYWDSIYNSTLIFSGVFIFAAAVATAVYCFIPQELAFKLDSFYSLIILSFNLMAIFLVMRLYSKRALSVFSAYVATIFFIIVLSVAYIFNFVYSTGENEIVKFSSYAFKPGNSAQLVTFDFSVKPSAMIGYRRTINFLPNQDFAELDDLLDYKQGPTYVIIKNKNLVGNNEYKTRIEKRLKLLQLGDRYSLYIGKKVPEKK